ncbi:MAG: InlB B-repeat-containing protein [Ignavibacteriae bacterium]|nr:InlB B-repeat-containing protein [Ignavibacteriota bacterium]
MKTFYQIRWLAVLILLLAVTSSVFTQVSTLGFTGSSGTFTPITGGTVHGTTSNDDENFNAIDIGFSFTYNGTAYTKVSIQNNGFVAMGSTVTSTYSAISATSPNNLIAALSGDLQSKADGELMSLMEGSAPNRVFTVQWKNYKHYGGPQTYNFQIRLYETSNKAEVVYGTMTAGGGSRTYQVGLKGSSNTDYNNRTTTTNWASTTAGGTNGASCTLTDAVNPASGQTFTWQESNQTYVSSTTTQNTSNVMRGTTNNQIIGMQIVISGTANPLSATQFDLNTTGTTSTSEISNAKIFYTGTSSTFATGTQFGATNATPSGSYSITGSQTLSAGTNYFWLTYDIVSGATPENVVDAECTSLTVGSAQTPTVTAPAGVRTIKSPLSGTKTIGATGANYTTLTLAASDLNNFGVEGATVFEFQSDYSGSETFPITFNTIAGASGTNNITIRPATGVTGKSISGSSTTGIIVLNGADYVTIDGRPGGSGTAKELTIENTSISSTSTANAIRFINDADYNTINYCTIKGGQSSTTGGVILFSTSTGTNGNDNNTVSNSDITMTAGGRPTAGVVFAGTAGKANTDNSIGSCNIFDWSGYAFYVGSNATNTMISQNNLYWTTTFSSALVKAIDLHATTVGGTSILRNKIYNIQTTHATPTIKGIDLYDASSTLVTTVANNFIVLDGSSTTNNALIYGIQDEAGTGRLFNIYYNTIYIGGSPTTGTSKNSVGFYRSYQGSTTNFKNNIVYNVRTNSGATGSHYAIYIDGAGLGTGLVSNYNNFYSSGSGSVLGYWETAATANLAAWQTASSQDANSKSKAVTFEDVTTGNVHLSGGSVGDGDLVAITGIGITTDIDGETRNTTVPYKGADENTTTSPSYALTVTAATGGLITAPASSPVSVIYGVATTITATANPGYHFTGWTVVSGSASIASASDLSTTATLTGGDATLQANFAINTYLLTVTVATGGTITAPSSSPVTVDHGVATTITAAASSGYRFTGWTVVSGFASIASASDLSTTATLTGDAEVQANFVITYLLTVTATTGGTITSPSSSPVTVDQGVATTITAEASSGYNFSGWTVVSGSASIASASDLSTTATLTGGDAAVQANFAINTYTLTVTAVNGSVAKVPDQATYDHGTSVQLTATPASGYNFISWSGDVPQGGSSTNPLTVTMDGNKNITANFAIPGITRVEEKFDGAAAIPDGWSVVPVPGYTGTPPNWIVRVPTRINTLTAYSAPYSAQFNSYDTPAGNEARLITPTFDFSTASVLEFNFRWADLLQGSRDSMAVEASIDGGTTWTRLAGYVTGPTGNAWVLQTINISSYIGQSAVKFAFHGYSRYGNVNVTIDNVVIGIPPANDVGVTAITLPSSTAYKTANTITATIQNFGSADKSAGDFNVHVKAWKTTGGSESSPEFDQTESGPAVTAGATQSFSFATQWTPAEFAAYTVKVYTELTGDQVSSNDAFSKSVTVVPATDLQITSVVFPPTTGLYTGSGYSVRASVKNNGTSASGTGYSVEAWIGLTAGFPGSATYHNYATFIPDIAAGATSNVDIPTTWTPTEPGLYTVRFKVTLTGDEVASNDSLDASRTVQSVHYGGPDGGGYYYITDGHSGTQKPAYNWLDITSVGTALNFTGDDQNSADITIPSFTLYGNTYTSLRVNNNGHIRFDGSANSSYYNNPSIPSATVPNYVLAPFWDDLGLVSGTTNIYYYNDAANSQFIIEYYQIPAYGQTTDLKTFEVVLNYSTNSLFFQYNTMAGSLGGSTVGIEGSGAAGMGTQWLYNGTPAAAVSALTNGRVIYFGTSSTTVPAIASLPTYTLGVTTVGSGSVAKSPDLPNYLVGTNVQLTATPATGWTFTGWSGDVSGSTNPLTVTMSGNKNITATFTINTHTLAITAVNGSVAKNPDQPTYDHGTTVQLTATPDSGYSFVNWTGDVLQGGSSENPLTVTMDSNKSITANFAMNTYTLTVNATNGSVAKNPDQASYNHGASVELTATPASGYHFVDWSGDVPQGGNTANPLTVIMDVNKTITANFATNTYTLTINATNGSVAKNPDQASYNHGTSVELTATPAYGYHFVNWSGDASGVTNPLTVIMDSNKTITANFAINTYTLTVTSTNGSVVKNPDQTSYNHGVTVQLTATPTTGYHFVNWSGDGSGTTNPLTVTMDGNKNITANFSINTYTLTIIAVNGSVTKNPDQPSYNHGVTVQLTATPVTGYHFVNWSGDVPQGGSTTNPVSVTMNSNKNITANFAINTYTLTVTSVNGSVTKIPDQTTYDYGTSVELTATPSTGYHFTGWSGDVIGTDNPVSVVMNGDKNVTANFAINTYSLNVTIDGEGIVAKDPDQSSYNHGIEVQLFATPEVGWLFTGWSGDASSSTNPIMVMMDNEKNVTANFTIDPLYQVKYRSVHPDSIALDKDNLGKMGKAVAKKATRVEFSFFVVVDANDVNDLHFELAKGIDTTFDFTITPIPVSAIPVATSSLKKWDVTFASVLNIGDTVVVSGFGNKGSVQKVQMYWWTKDNVIVGKKKSTGAVFTKNILRLPMPNRVNLAKETYEQGAFTTTNGMVAGVARSDSPKAYGWVTLKKYTDVMTSLKVVSRSVVNLHDGAAKGFEKYISGKNIVGKLTSLPPTKQDNKLFANLVGLKLSIAASALENTPLGFGELLFEDTASNSLNGLMLKQIAAEADTMMTGYVGRTFENAATYDNLYNSINRVLVAFEGAMDTISFSNKFVATGTAQLLDVPFLRANTSVLPERITPLEFIEQQIPEQYSLQQNYPNPFNPATTIQFELPVQSQVTLKIYNLLGQEVATILDRQQMEEGTQEVEFNAEGIGSGVYFYRLVANEMNDEDGLVNSFETVKKMILMK